MPVLYTNNATSTLSASITNVATSMSVAAGQGARFPAPGGSDYFYATLSDSAGNIEIVKVTARSTDTLTIVRAQDGTSARAWAAGDAFELRIVKLMLDDFKTDTRGSITTGAMGGNTVYLLGTTSSSAGTNQPLVGSGLSYNSSTGNLSVPGGVVLNAGNYASYALPTSGGTVSGNLVVANIAPLLVLKDTDNSGTGAGQIGWLSFQDSGGVERAWIGYGDSASTDLNISNTRGNVTIGGNIALHAGNYSTYALPKAGGELTGNLGVRVGVGAWRTDYAVIDYVGGSLVSTYSGDMRLYQNARYNTSNQHVYRNTAAASMFLNDSGAFSWQTAPSGTSGNVITFTERMSLSNTGTLNVTGAITQAGNQVVHAGNVSTYALPIGGGALTGALTLNATNELRLADTDSSHYVGFKSPATVSTSLIWTLPAADGTNGQVLTTNGTGTLSWTTPGGSSLIGVTDNSGTFRTVVGFQAGTGGSGSTNYGYQAGLNQTGGNTNIGYHAGRGGVSSAANITTVGRRAGYYVEGANNTFVGASAGEGVDVGTSNVALGSNASGSTPGGITGTIAVGAFAFYVGQGNYVVMVGDNAGYYSRGASNVGIGRQALYGVSGSSTGASNVAIGAQAMFGFTTGTQNVAVGDTALRNVTTGRYNTIVGHGSGTGITTGEQNTLIGYLAGTTGTNNVSGTNNILIGASAQASAAAVNNEITLGNASITRFRIPGLSVDWTSSNTPAVGPTFRAVRGTAQTVTANAWNKAQCNSEQWDTNSAYDNATNFRFQPTRAGYYLVTGNSAAAYSTIPSIWKNGGEYQTAGWGSGGSHMTVTALVYLNGSTDYVELYIWTDGTSFYQDQTAFSAVFVRA